MTVTTDELSRRLDELLDRVISGEELVVLKDDGRKFTVQPAAPERHDPYVGIEVTWPSRGGFGKFRGRYWMSDDFDEPLEDFREHT